jgi:hypothetical protein
VVGDERAVVVFVSPDPHPAIPHTSTQSINTRTGAPAAP